MTDGLREQIARAMAARRDDTAGCGAVMDVYGDLADAALTVIEASGFVILPAKLPYRTRERATIHTLRLRLGKGDADPWDTVDAVWDVIAARPRDTESRG